jgi:hypothetical protein
VRENFSNLGAIVDGTEIREFHHDLLIMNFKK